MLPKLFLCIKADYCMMMLIIISNLLKVLKVRETHVKFHRVSNTLALIEQQHKPMAM